MLVSVLSVVDWRSSTVKLVFASKHLVSVLGVVESAGKYQLAGSAGKSQLLTLSAFLG